MTALSDAIRAQVFDRAHHRCEYCQAPAAIGVMLQIDHIQPTSLGGGDEPDNLCAACDRCNLTKLNFITGIDPLTQTEMPLFNPRQQTWSEHFAWSEDATQVIGLTAVGRATIKRLNMNHEKQQQRRALWAWRYHKVRFPPPA